MTGRGSGALGLSARKYGSSERSRGPSVPCLESRGRDDRSLPLRRSVRLRNRSIGASCRAAERASRWLKQQTRVSFAKN